MRAPEGMAPYIAPQVLGRLNMKCHRDGCTSSACYHVGLELKCIGVGRHRMQVQMPSTIKVCDKRSHMMKCAEFILSSANRTQIAAGLTKQGMPLPDFSSAELVFVPISAAQTDWKAAREGGAKMRAH